MTLQPVPFTVQPVLYVEDNPVNAIPMGALFEQRPGLRLGVATSAAETLELALGLHPVSLLLDLQMPDSDGRNLLPQLRHVPGCEDAPAVATTAEPEFDLAGSGFTDLGRKPLHLPDVLSRLDAMTSSARFNRGGFVGLPSAGACPRTGHGSTQLYR